MSPLFEPFKSNNLEMSFENNILDIRGSIDFQEPEKIIGSYFRKIHNHVVEKGMKDIKINITNLSFLNSSGIKEFVEWIMNIESLENEKKYSITFLTNSEFLWQESSISTLMHLSPDNIKKIIQK
jgi:hypothetical protein